MLFPALLLLIAATPSAALGQSGAPSGAPAEEGFLGIALKQLKPKGVEVEGLASGAYAQKAGVQSGDLIVSYNGAPIDESKELIGLVKASRPGSIAKLVVSRRGKSQSFDILVVSRSEFLGAGIDALRGKPLPELTGTDIFTNKKVKTSQFAGKTPLVVELWATWCPGCRANIGPLDHLSRSRAGSVKVLAVSFEKPRVVRDFFSKHRPGYQLVTMDMNDTSFSYLTNSTIPKFIVADRGGTVVGVFHSADEASVALDGLK